MDLVQEKIILGPDNKWQIGVDELTGRVLWFRNNSSLSLLLTPENYNHHSHKNDSPKTFKNFPPGFYMRFILGVDKVFKLYISNQHYQKIYDGTNKRTR